MNDIEYKIKSSIKSYDYEVGLRNDSDHKIIPAWFLTHVDISIVSSFQAYGEYTVNLSGDWGCYYLPSQGFQWDDCDSWGQDHDISNCFCAWIWADEYCDLPMSNKGNELLEAVKKSIESAVRNYWESNGHLIEEEDEG